MKVYIEKDDVTKVIEVKNEVSVKDILKELNTSIESVIVLKNGSICLEDTLICNEDELKLLSVVSGG